MQVELAMVTFLDRLRIDFCHKKNLMRQHLCTPIKIQMSLLAPFGVLISNQLQLKARFAEYEVFFNCVYMFEHICVHIQICELSFSNILLLYMWIFFFNIVNRALVSKIKAAIMDCQHIRFQ